MSGRNSFKEEKLPQQVGECKYDMGEGKEPQAKVGWFFYNVKLPLGS